MIAWCACTALGCSSLEHLSKLKSGTGNLNYGMCHSRWELLTLIDSVRQYQCLLSCVNTMWQCQCFWCQQSLVLEQWSEVNDLHQVTWRQSHSMHFAYSAAATHSPLMWFLHVARFDIDSICLSGHFCFCLSHHIQEWHKWVIWQQRPHKPAAD